MATGTSNRVGVRYVKETVEGTTPSTPALTPVRLTGESINFKANFASSEEIRSDRMTADTIYTSGSAEGDINAELSYASFDDFFEAALFSTWATTGTAISAATDISITKTVATPNTWVLGASSSDFTAHSWVVGQFVKVAGFSPAGTFYAEITSLAAHSMGIRPTSNVATDAAGDSVTITPLNYLRNGTTKTTFTIQKAFQDLTAPEYWNFTGAVVSSMQLDVQTGSITKLAFGFKARDGVMTETQIAGATVGTPNTNSVMDSGDNVASITFDGDPGAATTYYFNQLSLKADNNVRTLNAVGSVAAIGVNAGRSAVSGSIELYFSDSSQYDKFRARTVFEFSVMMADTAGQRYFVTLPRCKFTDMTIVAGGLDKDIMASASFEVLANSASTYQLQISRSAT
jgi:hypothetical protein